MALFYKIVSSVVGVINLLLIIRVLCSWIPELRYGKIHSISVRLTEPLLSPLRRFLLRFEIFRQIPVDMSYIALYFILRFINKVIFRIAYFRFM